MAEIHLDADLTSVMRRLAEAGKEVKDVCKVSSNELGPTSSVGGRRPVRSRFDRVLDSPGR